MNNRMKLDALSTKEYAVTIKALMRHPLINYIDLESYLDSENDDISAFIQHKGKCEVLPSEMARMVNRNAKQKSNCLLLDYVELIGTKYAIVADLDTCKILKTPICNLKMVD